MRVPLIGGPSRGKTVEWGSCVAVEIPEYVRLPMLALAEGSAIVPTGRSFVRHRWIAVTTPDIYPGFYAYQGTPTGNAITTGNDRFPYSAMPEHKERRKAMRGMVGVKR